MLNVFELQKKLVSAALPSGFESGVAKVIEEIVKPYADEVYTDALGNLIAHKKGSGKKIMMPAHMDTIGFMATYIDEKGFVRVTSIGGISAANIIATPAIIIFLLIRLLARLAFSSITRSSRSRLEIPS